MFNFFKKKYHYFCIANYYNASQYSSFNSSTEYSFHTDEKDQEKYIPQIIIEIEKKLKLMNINPTELYLTTIRYEKCNCP